MPYPAGGSTDVLSRILGERLKDIFSQPFVIENRPGAGGNIGIGAVTGSAPDGYTIGSATIGHFAINQFLYKHDALRSGTRHDTGVADLGTAERFRRRHRPCAGEDARRILTWAKQKGKLNFGSPGVGTSPHLSGVLFAKRAGLDAVHVPFRGAAQTIPAMLSGDVDFRHRQSRLLHRADPVRQDAGAGGDLGEALADLARRADHGGSRGEGFRRHLLGGLCAARRHAARRSSTRSPPRMKKIAADGACRSASWSPARAPLLDAGGGHRLRRKERAMWKDVVALSGLKPQ